MISVRKPCSWVGCGRLVGRGERFCAEHVTAHWQRDVRERGTPAERGIDGLWRKLRTAHMQRQPYCVECLSEGRQTIGQIVDHIRPHRGDDALRLSPTNLQTLCRRHHARKTATEGPGYRARGTRGA